MDIKVLVGVAVSDLRPLQYSFISIPYQQPQVSAQQTNLLPEYESEPLLKEFSIESDHALKRKSSLESQGCSEALVPALHLLVSHSMIFIATSLP